MSAFDITRPEHRKALRWACAEHGRVLSGQLGSDLARVYYRALFSPSDSAAIVRALLEGCGINAHVEQWPMTTDGDHVVMWSANEGAYSHGSHVAITRGMAKMPTLILRLLACTTCEEALVALQEHGQ